MSRKTLRRVRESLQGGERLLTHLPVERAIVLLSIPMMLEMLMESLFAVVDVFFVARLGTEAVAAVGLTESVMMLDYSLAIGLSMAATAMVARRVGEGDRDGAAPTAVQVLWLGIGTSVVMGIAGWYFTGDILRLMGAEDKVLEQGSGYARILFTGNATVMLLFLLNAVFRGAGDASLAMRSLWLANGINIILDPCLIFGWGPFPEMGIEGAAVATVIGRGIGVAYQLWHLFRGTHIVRVARRHLNWAWDTVGRLFSIGSVGAGQYLVASASWLFLTRIVADFGPDAMAGYTIAIRVMVFSILPAWGIANAASTLVGQHLGAGQPDEAERSTWKASRYAVLFMLGIMVLYLAMAGPIIGLFTSVPTVVAEGTEALRVISLGYAFYGLGMVLSQGFNGAGDTRTPMLLNIVGFWMLEIPLAWFLAGPAGWGPTGVYAAVALAESAVAVGAIWFFRRGRWKTIQV